jgi:hypothetical protein
MFLTIAALSILVLLIVTDKGVKKHVKRNTRPMGSLICRKQIPA